MAQPNWQTIVRGDDFSNVMRLVHLAARMTDENVENLKAQLLRTRRRSFETELDRLSKTVGCDRKSIVDSGPELSAMSDLSATDAQSIVDTYNRDLALAVIVTRAETPRANRNTYASRLTKWDKNRSSWKDRQVAMQSVLDARSLAQKSFHELNPGLEGSAILIGPDPAREPICQGWLNRGRVDIQVAINNPSPFHLNCPHTWEITHTSKLNKDECRDLWMG